MEHGTPFDEIIYLNPHADDFIAEPVSFRLLKRRSLKKYAYLFDMILAKHKIINIYIDGTLSSLIPDKLFNLFPYFLRRCFLYFELRRWVKINSLKNKVKFYFDYNKCKHINVLHMFSYKCARRPFAKRLEALNNFKIVLTNLSHYMVNTSEKAGNLSKVKNLVLIGESDISQNGYFKKHFSWYQKAILVIPFVVADRFQMFNDFYLRQKKCLATGSFHDLSAEIPSSYYEDFITYFSETTYHPTRKMLYDAKASNVDWLDCLVNPYRNMRNQSVFKKIISHFKVSQKSYFKIDIVEKYNSVQFVVVGEELNGFPALGAFEAMACGAVLLARSSEYYLGLNLKENKHYFIHDGTVEGIKKLVHQYSEKQDDAARVAKNGMNYVNKYMRGAYSFNKLLDFIRKEHDK